MSVDDPVPSVEEFQRRVEERAYGADLSGDEIGRLVHDARGPDEREEL